MYTLRTRFKKDIVSEFLPPITRSKKPSRKVIILCGGMPGYPGRREALCEFLARQGYWVFVPRYRGTWESGGKFLQKSPHQDVLDIIDQLPRGFKDLWSRKIYKITQPEVYVIGSSFGGPAAILASRDSRVKKVLALSPVTDWRVESKAESIATLKRIAQEGFGNGYRTDKSGWKKLKNGKFYNPVHEIASIDGNKLFIIHAKDDQIVYAKTSIAFARKTDTKILLLKKGGHLSLSIISKPKFWKEIKKFLKQS